MEVGQVIVGRVGVCEGICGRRCSVKLGKIQTLRGRFFSRIRYCVQKA